MEGTLAETDPPLKAVNVSGCCDFLIEGRGSNLKRRYLTDAQAGPGHRLPLLNKGPEAGCLSPYRPQCMPHGLKPVLTYIPVCSDTCDHFSTHGLILAIYLTKWMTDIGGFCVGVRTFQTDI